MNVVSVMVAIVPVNRGVSDPESLPITHLVYASQIRRTRSVRDYRRSASLIPSVGTPRIDMYCGKIS